LADRLAGHVKKKKLYCSKNPILNCLVLSLTEFRCGFQKWYFSYVNQRAAALNRYLEAKSNDLTNVLLVESRLRVRYESLNIGQAYDQFRKFLFIINCCEENVYTFLFSFRRIVQPKSFIGQSNLFSTMRSCGQKFNRWLLCEIFLWKLLSFIFVFP
jgi:hypothetical protein